MFSAFVRAAARRPTRIPRQRHALNLSRSLSTQARSAIRGKQLEWMFGTVALAGALAWSQAVYLDAETHKPETKVRPKKQTASVGEQKPDQNTEARVQSPITEVDPPSVDEAESQSPEADSGNEDGHGGAAYNPETGEINWDCPCLGGMAHGPCGQEFRAAFSCFVYSEEEPKGINCVELFKSMQDCFRAHPDVYGEEIMDDGDDDTQDKVSSESENASRENIAEPIDTPQATEPSTS